jgi:hypothetical protein
MANTSTDVSAGCNCLAVRQAARYITQFYDQHLAAAGLRTTQYGILAKLKRHGPMSINAPAAESAATATWWGHLRLRSYGASPPARCCEYPRVEASSREVSLSPPRRTPQ